MKKNNCIDNSNKCSDFAKSGKCIKFKNVAEKLCKKSCGFCNPSVKDLIDIHKRNNSVYHTFDPILYKINDEANEREKKLHFNDIYGNTHKVHNFHIKKIKDDAFERDEILEIDETSLDKEILLKSNEENIWKDYLEFQAKNRFESGKVSDKYRKDKQGYILSLNLNKTWEKELEAILLKMRNNKLPYSKDNLLKSKKMNKKLTYNDIINVVDSIKKKIEKKNKLYRQKIVTSKPFKIPDDNMILTVNLKKNKKKSIYIKKGIKKNKELIDYLNKVKKEIGVKQKIIESMMEIDKGYINYIPNRDAIQQNKIPKYIKYILTVSIILICYGIIIRLVTKK